MIMRNRIIILIATIVLMLSYGGVVAQTQPLYADKWHIEDLLERSRWADARVELTEFVENYSSHAELFEREWADYSFIRCAVGLGDEDARSAMQEYIESYPEGVYTNNVRFILASDYCDSRDLRLAAEAFEDVSYKALSGRDKERYDIRMGYIYFADESYDRAKQYFERIPATSLYHPHALYYLSYIDYAAGNNKEARKGFKKLRDNASYKSLIPFYMLQLDYREGDYDNVVKEGEKLLKGASAEVRDDLLRIIAESYFVKGDYAQALRYINQYPASKVDRQENYIRGYSLYRLGRYADAVEPLKGVCGAEDALTQNASYHLGDCYLRLDDKQHAADAFAMAATDGYDDAMAEEALLNYGRLKYELGGGLFNEAVNILQRYLEKYPHSQHESEVKQLLIAAYYNSRNYASAYAAMHEFQNPDRELRAAQQKVALFCAVDAVKRGELDVAEKLLNESEQIGLTPKYNALTLYWQAEVAYEKGNMKRAKECYEAYIRRAPKSEAEYAFAHYGLGYTLLSEQSMKPAADAFDTFVRRYNKRDNYLYDAQNRLGDARFAMREFSAARKAYNISAASSFAERDYALYQLALVDGIESKIGSKIERLRSIVDSREGDYLDDAWYELGRTYITQEKYSDGASVLQSFVKECKTSPYYITALSELGLAYYNLNRKDDARRCYEEVVAYDPQSSAAMEAMRGIREIYVAEGDVDEYFAYAERSGVQSDMSSAARDSLTFAVAKNIYLEGNMDQARVKLRNYLDSFDKGYNRSEALFYLIDCHIEAEEQQEALVAMDELLSHGNTQYTERVLRVMAPMSYNLGDYTRSADAYRRLWREASESAVRSSSSEGYVDAALRSGNDALIESMTDDILTLGQATPWAKRQAMLAKAHMLRRNGDTSAAEELYVELAEDRMSEEGAEAYYHLIAAKYAAGDYKGVEQMVYDMGECGSMYWQAKAFMLLGDALVRMDNIFQARATYQSIVDGYSPKDDGIVDEAKDRIANL